MQGRGLGARLMRLDAVSRARVFFIIFFYGDIFQNLRRLVYSVWMISPVFFQMYQLTALDRLLLTLNKGQRFENRESLATFH